MPAVAASVLLRLQGSDRICRADRRDRIERQLAALDARHVEQVLDQSVHPGRGALDPVHTLARRIAPAPSHDRRLREDDAERIS